MLSPIILVCLDMQRGFLEPGLLRAPNAATALMHGRRMLAFAREQRWSIAHCLLRRDTGPFAMSLTSSRPVDGFEPLVREMVFERETLSAYGHADFERLMGNIRNGALVTGLCASLSFLATSIDAFERGHRLILAGDALAGPVGFEREASVHEAVARDIARMLGFYVADSDWAAPHAPARLEHQQIQDNQAIGGDE